MNFYVKLLTYHKNASKELHIDLQIRRSTSDDLLSRYGA